MVHVSPQSSLLLSEFLSCLIVAINDTFTTEVSRAIFQSKNPEMVFHPGKRYQLKTGYHSLKKLYQTNISRKSLPIRLLFIIFNCENITTSTIMGLLHILRVLHACGTFVIDDVMPLLEFL